MIKKDEHDDQLKLITQNNELRSLLDNNSKSSLRRKLSKVTAEDKLFIIENLGGAFNSSTFKTIGRNIRDQYELSDREAIDYINKIISSHKKKKTKLPF